MSTEHTDTGASARAARQDVMRSMVTGDWGRALEKVDEAERLFDEVLGEGHEGSVEAELLEERALCEVHRADISIRFWRVQEAEQALDRAYAVLKKGSVEAELYRVTARIAERRGRWSSARAAWKRAYKLAQSASEAVAADAQLRLAEIALHEGRAEACEEHLATVRELRLDDPLVGRRVDILRAELDSLAGDVDASLDAWKDLARELDGLPQDFIALTNLRRAGTEVHRAPVAAVRRVLRAAELLQRIAHPDALGLAYGQLAVLATALRRPVIGALCAVGANASRDGDTVAHALLRAAVEHAELDIDVESLEARQLQEALVGVLAGPARELGIAWSDLGSAKALEKLAAPLKAVGSAGVRVDVESGQVVHAAQLVGHRSSLTWDAPLGVLRTVKLARPVVMPKRPQMYAPPSPARGIQATPPPAVVRTPTRDAEIKLIGVGTLVAAMGFFGVVLLAAVVVFVGTRDRRPSPAVVSAPVERPVPVVVPKEDRPVFEILSDDVGEEVARTPVLFSSTNRSSGEVELRRPGFVAVWRSGPAEAELPVGSYLITLNGEPQAEPIVVEDSERCRLRWIGQVLVVACD